MTDEKRKTFATTVYPSITKNFKISCATKEQSMNEVLEYLMQLYVDDKIVVPKEQKK